MLKRYKGSFFDPLIVDAFVKHVVKYKDLSQIIEWPKDISKIMPTGYKPGCFQMGGHYADFYSGEIHFMVKAVGCIAGGLINQEKCLYLTDDRKEKHILRNLVIGQHFWMKTLLLYAIYGNKYRLRGNPRKR
ncbi:MAG TPA: hypothetical protein DCQ14_06075 [Firmicutes bacterium]|nr:hypothetical protein [Bacillota bacterium]